MGWDLSAVQQLIADQIQESQSLEYKAADALSKADGKKTEITKDVSALANAAGGTLIYGVAEYQDASKKHFPEKIDPVDPTQFSREWLEQIINGIRPRIDGVKIHLIVISINQCLYIVEVPQSMTAHQAQDNRYYKRYNFQALPMLDHEIRDVMGRQQHPNITIEFTIRSTQLIGMKKVKLIITARNIGRTVARYVNCRVYLPQSLSSQSVSLFGREIEVLEGQKYYIINKTNTERDVIEEDESGKHKYGSSWYAPILPSLEHIWDYELPSNVTRLQLPSTECILWEVFADDAPKRTGKIALNQVVFVHEQAKHKDLARAIWKDRSMKSLLIALLVIAISLVAFTQFPRIINFLTSL